MKDLETLCVYAGIKRFSAANIESKHAPDAVPAIEPVCSGFLWTFAALSSLYDQLFAFFRDVGGSTDIPCRC